MDVLSDAIAVMRTGRPHSARATRSGSWAVRHPSFRGAGFHVVLQGSCQLIPEGGTPIALGPGDIAFLPHGGAHALSDGSSVPVPDLPAVPLTDLADDTLPAGSVVLLCGAYLLDGARPHPLLSELPPVVHLPARVGQHAALRSLVDLLAAELTSRGPGADAIVPALLDALLTYMLRGCFDEGHPATGWSAALTDPAIRVS